MCPAILADLTSSFLDRNLPNYSFGSDAPYQNSPTAIEKCIVSRTDFRLLATLSKLAAMSRGGQGEAGYYGRLIGNRIVGSIETSVVGRSMRGTEFGNPLFPPSDAIYQFHVHAFAGGGRYVGPSSSDLRDLEMANDYASGKPIIGFVMENDLIYSYGRKNSASVSGCPQ
jgi:hypothetical protein